jgi:two-component system osmolarity sensor histidine kinase EnvZ
MTAPDAGLATLRTSVTALRSLAGRWNAAYQPLAIALKRYMPKGLFGRSLMIIIAPMVLLQSVVAYMFMERHYNLVTQRLSAGVVQDIATLIEV